MNKYDYTDLKELFKKYQEKFATLFTSQQNDLANEMSNKLDDLSEISNEIVDLVTFLVPINDISPDQNDEIIFGPFKIKLQRADPNVPVKLNNFAAAYPRGKSDPLSKREDYKLRSELERRTAEYYQIAHRITHIAENLPKLAFKSKAIRIIRNQLIEHPEGKTSGITFDAFSYSLNEGPFVKGFRKSGQLNFMDKGFKANNEEFVSSLKQTLENALR